MSMPASRGRSWTTLLCDGAVRKRTREGIDEVSDDQREVLRAAQSRAIAVLKASNTEAERISDEAESEAITLRFEQQRLAKRVLSQEQCDASTSDDTPRDTEALLESHRTAAELLEATDRDEAARLDATKMNAAVSGLMRGQREAAAILLEAWMELTEQRQLVCE